MSRQSKAFTKNKLAKQFSKVRKDGGHGPATTVKKHGKVKCWYRDREAYYRRNEKTIGGRKNPFAKVD